MKYKNIISIACAAMLSISMISCTSEQSEVNNSQNEEEVVVATSVAVVEILDALGVKVSGVPTTSYKLPESTEGAVEVGNPMSPDLEIIKSLKPTSVISVDTLGSDYIELFTQNNISGEFVSLESLDGLKESVRTLGEKFNKSEEANKILSEIEAKQQEIEDETKILEKPELMVLFAAPGSTMLATSKSYIGNLVKMVGGSNVIKDEHSSFVTINKEALATLNPDKILVMTHAMPEETKAALQKEMASDATWQRINAVKENRLVYLDSIYFGMSANLKVVEGLDILKDIVHGDG